PDGSTYITDGYGNSRVVKFTKEGNLVKYWGDRGARPGQFNTPHSIVIDANANLYVADRQNSRVQVFDTEGKFKQEWPLDGLACIATLERSCQTHRVTGRLERAGGARVAS